MFIGLFLISTLITFAQPRKKTSKPKSLSIEQKADQFFRQKKWALAAQAFTTVLQRGDKNAEYFYKRGFCYSSLAKHEPALNDYDQAIKLNLQTGEVFFGRGIEFANAKKHTEAVTDFDRAIALGFAKWNVYYARGDSHHKLKNHQAAIPDFTRAVELITEKDEDFYMMSFLIYQLRADSYFELQNYEMALRDYGVALEFNSDDPALYRDRAKTLRKLNKIKEAEADEATLKEMTQPKQ